MRVIPPLTITDAMLTSSTVLETAPAAYAGGTTYAAGDQVSVAAGTVLTCYESLQGSNTGHTPSTSPTWWKNIGVTYAEWAIGTTYALDDIVIVAATHKTYKSLVASNTGNAVTDTTKWTDLGPTNRWKMLDMLRNTQTTVPSPLTVVLTPGVRCNTIALMGLIADSVTITVTSGGSTVSTATETLSRRLTAGWYDYFYGTFSNRKGLVKYTIPPYTNAVITVTLARSSGDVSCGACAIGNSEYIGKMKPQPECDTLNFSTVTRDETTGESILVPRRNVPKTNQVLMLEKHLINRVRELKDDLNASPAVWFGVEDDSSDFFESFLILGYYRQFSFSMDNNNFALIALELEEI